MQMRPQIQIQSVIKAITDVVLPAVDPANKLAQEQARLAIGLLTLMGQQLPVQFRFDCDELQRLIECAQDLLAKARGGTQTGAALAGLEGATCAARVALDAARTSPQEIEQQVRALRAATGALVTQVYHDGEPASRDAVCNSVLALSREQLLRDRSMLLMQGWEPDPKAIPSLDSLLSTKPR